MIVYTIGRTTSYNQAFEEEEIVKKLGKSNDYIGGWIWRTQEEAEHFLWSDYFLNVNWGAEIYRQPVDFSVYGVIINNWDQDVYLSNTDNQYHLINDSVLIKIPVKFTLK